MVLMKWATAPQAGEGSGEREGIHVLNRLTLSGRVTNMFYNVMLVRDPQSWLNTATASSNHVEFNPQPHINHNETTLALPHDKQRGRGYLWSHDIATRTWLRDSANVELLTLDRG